jgi:hypothetical protein
MFKEITIIDNFFKDPHKIVALALSQQYYAVKENPEYEKDSHIYYNGKRTVFLKYILEKNVYENLSNEILTNIINNAIRKESKINISADMGCLFHSLTENDVYDKNNTHQDTVLFAGVVYLNENLESNTHGTLVNNITIPYKFNRLVLYRGDLLHCPLNGYGKDITKSRLSLNIFINKLDLSLSGTIISKIQ